MYYQEGHIDSLHSAWKEEFTPQELYSDFNLYWSPDFSEECANLISTTIKTRGVDIHSQCADPLFYDVENGDFRVKEGSPLFALEIKPIDMTGIGLIVNPKK